MKITLSILMCVLVSFIAFASNEELIRNQFVEYYTQTLPSGPTLQGHLNGVRVDGTWVDVDYASQRRGNWPTRIHLDRLTGMASSYVDPASNFYRDEAMKQAVLNGLNHWIENDYRNPNWYNERIGVPYRLGSVLLLMGDTVPDEMLEAARPILYRSELGMTGQNKVWCGGIGIMKGVLYADDALLERAVADVWSELRVSTGEGIQPDWSFHQHGPQQQFGNYGLSFGDDMVQWASVLRGTEYALTGDTLAILRNYLLEGPSWIVWDGRMDLSGCGRQIGQGCQQRKARSLQRQLESMQTIDPHSAVAYGSTLERVGFQPFWRSAMGVQRRSDWYASVKMSSTRVIGAESCNSENMRGLHLGDGVLLTYINGDEYEDIVPLWDWKRLPGTTCDQGFDELVPGTFDEFGGSDFAGVLSLGETGIASMIYQRGELTARKSWFFLEDHIVCVGAGIVGDTAGAVFTSVEQSWLRGEVKQAKDWIWHNGVGYQFLTGRPEMVTGDVAGNWNLSFPTRGDRPESGKVFSVWIDHGKSPEDAQYVYRIFPGLTMAQMETITLRDQSQLLSHSSTVQAVASGGVVYAVYYESGMQNLGTTGPVEVNGPCLLILDAEKMFVADPTHSLQALEIKVNGKVYSVNLPQGEKKGSQVEVQL